MLKVLREYFENWYLFGVEHEIQRTIVEYEYLHSFMCYVGK
jgi:hypothetical protein